MSDVKLRLYNTLTRSKEVFDPIDPKNVRMYVCGPTVYDFAHIGNARPAIVFDVLFRLLRHLYGENRVTYVRNITDVDDKINARALRDFGEEIETGMLTLNQAIRKVTEKTDNQYQKDVTALGCLPPTFQPRATEYVLPRADGTTNMKDMIQSLLDREHAYVSRGVEGSEVLFRVNSMSDYGALSNRKLEDQLAGARVEVDTHKENPADFVLWKESGAREPGWNAEFTPNPISGYEAEFKLSRENARQLGLNSQTITIHGRPGWHIECSVMSDALLWHDARDRLSVEAHNHPHQFDIHGGGLDLIFPHHENEIAQSRCAHGTAVMANYWMHNGFLQVEGQKMSKSLGNFFTIAELLETENFGGRKWPGEVLRLAMLMTHYREPIDFSGARLVEASAIYNDWMREAKRWMPSSEGPDAGVISKLTDDLDVVAAKIEIDRLVLKARSTGKDLMEKSKAGSTLSATLLWLGLASEEDFADARANRASIQQSLDTAADKVDEALRFAADHTSTADLRLFLERVDPPQANAAIESRLLEIENKNWAEADRVRDELLAQGIQLKDGKDLATGERVTTWEVKR